MKSFSSFREAQEVKTDFSSPLEWWDMGKFYLRELSCSFCKAKAMAASQTKHSLTRRFNQLQRQMDADNSSVFSEFCQIQEDLRAQELRASQAAQFRARTQWVEEEEVSSSYVFSLERKHQQKKVMSGIIDPSSGTVPQDPLEILAIWRSYYSELFSTEPCDSAVQSELLTQLELALSEEESSSCEGLLTPEECELALQEMFSGKTPGSDGFPMEFYTTFWDILGLDLVRVLNFAYSHGRLSVWQRRGMIIILYKKGDRMVTKNWRPISLLNVDFQSIPHVQLRVACLV